MACTSTSHRTRSTLGPDHGQLYKSLFHQQPRQPMTRVVGVASHQRPPGPSMSSAPVPTYTRWPWHQPGIHSFNGPWSQNCPAEGGECPAGWGLCPITSPVTPSIFTSSCLCSEGQRSQHPVKDSGLRHAHQPGSPRSRPGTGSAMCTQHRWPGNASLLPEYSGQGARSGPVEGFRLCEFHFPILPGLYCMK